MRHDTILNHSTNQTCADCAEPSKQIVGWYDGPENRGEIINCDNESCPYAIEIKGRQDAINKEIENNRDINARNGINASSVRMRIRNSRRLIYDVANMCNISSSELSSYLSETKPFPVSLYRKMERLGII